MASRPPPAFAQINPLMHTTPVCSRQRTRYHTFTIGHRASRQRPVFWLTIGLAAPGPARLPDSPWLLDCIERTQRVVDDAELLCAIERLAKWVAKRPFQMERAWRAHLLGNLFQTDNADSRNPGGLDCASDQSHGLVADASGRREQHRIDLLLLELVGNLRRCALQERRDVRRLNMAHEAVAGGERADLPTAHEIAEQPQREQDV